MKEKEITFADLIKHIESGKSEHVRLYSFQLAQMFGVYERTIISNVKAIIQSGLIIPSTTCEMRQMGNVLIPDTHDLEMIIALSFRIRSSETAKLRKWMIGKLSCRAERELTVFAMSNSVIQN